MSGRTFYPSTLYYVQTFVQQLELQSLDRAPAYESEQANVPAAGNGLRVVRQDPSIEMQIMKWVNDTRNLIVSSSPVGVHFTEYSADSPKLVGGQRVDVREVKTVTIIYAPALPQEIQTHGQQTGALVGLDKDFAVVRADAVNSASTVANSGGEQTTTEEQRKLRIPSI